MRLKRFKVANYKIVADTGWVTVDEWVTSLVGKNESGKSAILKALWKTKNSAGAKFDKLTDFPRDRYTAERKGDQLITALEFTLTPQESAELGALIPDYSGPGPALVTVNTYFKGEEETRQQVEFAELTASIRRGREAMQAIDAVVTGLTSVAGDRTAFETAVNAAREQINPEKALWKKSNSQLLQAVKQAADKLDVAPEQATTERATLAQVIAVASGGDLTEPASKWVLENMPSFIYFSDYGQLKTKINLPAFIGRGPKPADAETRTQRALFSWSKLDANELQQLGRPKEQHEADDAVQRRKDKRRVLTESASISLTGDWVTWWTEKRHEMHFDTDGDDLVLLVSDEHNKFRIPFEERSQGFQWFFSFYLVFLVESEGAHQDAILLLDEPGMHLHPTLQQRLVGLFERISKQNQLLYSTHLPFLIDGDHLERVRTVYRDPSFQRSIVSADIRAGADKDTLFPLQAALGYSIAQTLFMGKRTVIVEGVTDYWLLKALDSHIAARNGRSLHPDTVLVPAGGTSRLMPLAGLMFSTTGDAGSKMLVVLDSDTEGNRAASQLARDLFVKDSRTMLLGQPLNLQAATIEDLVDRTQYIQAVQQSGYAVTPTPQELTASTTLECLKAAFVRQGLGEFAAAAKSSAALCLIDEWARNPASLSQTTVDRAQQVIDAINARFT